MDVKLGMGQIPFWGVTPAVNLCSFISELMFEEAINILLVSEGDARHSLKTIVESHRKPNKKINIYIMEIRLELYARDLLFFILAFDTQNGLIERRNQFMEIFANLVIRPQTKRCLDELSKLAIEMLTDEECLKEILPMLSISKMKFQEIDALVEIFEKWIKHSNIKDNYHAESAWENRLRNHLEMRFDSKDGIFDWDYNMSLLDKNESLGIISFEEYKNWRKTGVAFADNESHYSQANPTLLTGIRNHRNSTLLNCVLHYDWKYLGDIVTGPFISHGVEGDEELFEKQNKQFVKKSFDIAASNIEKIFTSAATLDLNSVSVNFLSGSNISASLARMSEKEEFKGFFHCVFLGTHSAQEVNEKITTLLNDNGILLVEGIKYSVSFRKEQEPLLEEKVEELGKKAGLKIFSSPSDLFIKMKKIFIE